MPKKKLHVSYDNPIDSILTFRIMAKCLPHRILKKLAISMSAPKKRPLDVYDVLQEDPNEIIEIEESKVWLVTYKTGGTFKPKDGVKYGLSSEEKNYEKVMDAAKLGGNEEVEQAKKDWKVFMDYCAIVPAVGEQGQYLKANRMILNMVVVKLQSGGILLYSPIQVHDGTTLDKWLNDLGPVKYIVIGSCNHTTYLPSTISRYPDAIIIGTTVTEEKLKAVDALPRQKLDYNFLNASDIKSANDVLNSEGVVLKYIKGDVLEHAIFLIAFETGVECDLLYGHHDNCKCNFCKGQGIFEGTKSDPEYFLLRLFGWRMMRKPNSPFGYLPPYRFSAMDPTSTFSQFNWTPPASDGSSCNDMAHSLRDVLSTDYKTVVSVHWGIIPGGDFKISINKDWKWLDGSTILSK